MFEGGTDLSGVLDVCGDESADRLPRDQIVGYLGALVARSLVTVDRTPSGVRYRMLVPIQSFARMMLERSGEADLIGRRHVDHVIRWLADNARTIESAEPLAGLVALDRAAGNIRSAYRWCRLHRHDVLAAELVSSISLLTYHENRAVPELASWVTESLTTPDLPALIQMRLLLAAALASISRPASRSSRRRRRSSSPILWPTSMRS